MTEQACEAVQRGPEVTVVVAAHAERRFLRRCLASVRNQRSVRWECFVVDDASTDGTLDLAEEIARGDGRIRVLRHPENRGLGAARNSGLSAATAPLVTFLDADDHLFPGSLSRRVAAVTDAADVLGSFADWVSVGERSRWPVAPRRGVRRPDVTLVSADRSVPFVASAPVLRTDVIRAIGGFREDVTTAEDADLWSWWLRLPGRVVGTAGHAVAYRRRRSSMTRRDLLGHAEANRAAMRCLDRQLELPPDVAAFDRPILAYWEEATVLPRFLHVVAAELERGQTTTALDGFDPLLLRVLGPRSLAAQAVTALLRRRPGRRRIRPEARRSLVNAVQVRIEGVASAELAPGDVRRAAAALRAHRAGVLLDVDRTIG